MPTIYACAPGHEIVGGVNKVGSAITKFQPGDIDLVRSMVDSDGTYAECQAGLKQFCRDATLTYNAPDEHLEGVAKGKESGVAGLGGLGHVGVKFVHALGAHVVVFTTSPNKKKTRCGSEATKSSCPGTPTSKSARSRRSTKLAKDCSGPM